MAAFLQLVRGRAGVATSAVATSMAVGILICFNAPLYVLMERNRSRWQAGTSSPTTFWVAGCLIGGGNLAITILLLFRGTRLNQEIEWLLLISTLVCTITAVLVTLLLLPKILDLSSPNLKLRDFSNRKNSP
jgi:hypothetical protein